jgi:pimeloyl-ACP methyl ester carboxylesterase
MADLRTTTTADGVDIAYRVDGSGPPIVLVHGLADDHHSFDGIVERLAPSHTCVRLDLRGHGASSLADAHSSIAMAGDVGAVIEATGIERPTLVGHSLGAMVATAYASGSSTRGVVNLDQSARLADFAARLRPLEASLRGPDFRAIFTAMMAALGTDLLAPDERERIHAGLEAIDERVVLDVWGAVFDADDLALTTLAEGLLGGIRVPYVAVHGSDPGPGYADWLTGLAPTARVEVWEGLGHWVHLVDPDRVAEVIRSVAAG